MGLLVPLALSLAGLSLPILFFYVLKLRRPEQVVSSTMLWRQVLRDRQANAPWQRLRRNLLLLLQLLLLLLLVLALARPYSEISTLSQGNAVVLLDASASMQATDVRPSRFEAARDRARQFVDGLGPNDTMTLIAVADVPRVLASVTNDRAVLRQALAQAKVSNSEADWEAAIVLAASSAQQALDTTIILLSDGGLPAELPALRARLPDTSKLRYVPIGFSADNRALAALALADGPNGPRAFARVSNPGPQPANTLLEIHVDGALYDARTLDLPPRGEQSIPLDDLPLETRQIRATIAGDDALSLDNTAWAVRAPRDRATVILVTAGNTFLERATGLVPHLDVITVRVTDTLAISTSAPTEATAPAPTANAHPLLPGEQADLIIYDGVLPALRAQLPEAGNLFFIDPPAPMPGIFDVVGVLTQTQIVEVEANSPLLRYVNLGETHIARARHVVPPPWAEVLVAARGGPLLWAGEAPGGRRVAVLSFDLHHSNLPLQVAFPILIANLGTWLAPTSAVETPTANGQGTLRPGAPVTLRPPVGVDKVTVRSPSGQAWSYSVEGSQAIPFAETNELGVYAVALHKGPEVVETHFAVNLFSELESAVEPRDEIAIGEAPVAGQPGETVGRREWWRWPALAGLAVLLVEWVVYWQRRTWRLFSNHLP
jgi:hypothetical protein